MEEPKPPSPPPPTTTRAAAKEAAFVNFRSLIVQYVMASSPNMVSKKDQIERRIQELVPTCATPRHPTYKWMIEDAITQLNEERGSNIQSISEFILSEHKDLLPLAHTTLLKHHLKNLCESGSLVVNDNGLYCLGEENNEPEPEPNPATDSDPDPILDYIYESDSTSSSGESFSPIVEIEMSKRCEDKTIGKRTRSKGKNVHCRARSRKKDLLVGIELEQENEADEERPNVSQRIVSENPVSRVTGKQEQKRKRGRPRKNITTSSNPTSQPWEKQRSVRMNVNIAVAEGTLVEQDEVVADNQNQQNEADESQRIVSENPVSRITGQQDQKRKRGRPRKNVNIAVAQGTRIEQDEVVADNQNQQNEDQEFLPRNEVFIVDNDYTANITRMEQFDEDMEDLDLLIDHVCMELQAVNATQSFTIEDEVIHPGTEEQHRVHLNKDLINDRCQVEQSTMVTDIVPVEQKFELSMERAKSLQKDALMEETGRSMNITEANGIHNLNEITEVENKNQNETIDLVNSNCQAEPNCTVAMDIAPEEQERQVSREGTELLQNDELMAKTRMNVPEARECGEEYDVNEQSLDNQACLMDDVEFREQESGGIEVEYHLKDAREILKERDEQAITDHPEVYECEVGTERTESLQRDVRVDETAKSVNKTEANEIHDLIEELEFENENHNEPNETIDLANGDSRSEPSTMVINVALEDKEHQVNMEKTESLQNETRKEETEMNVTAIKECGKERDTNEQSVCDQTCLMNDVERLEQDSDVTEENNHLKDACEIFEEQDDQAITEQNHPDEHECEVIMERTESSQNYVHIEETGKDTIETEAIGVDDLGSEEKKVKDNQNEPTEVNECDEEMECYVNEQSAEDQACKVNCVELQKQEVEENRFPEEPEEENHSKDACKFVEERDQVITEQYQLDKKNEELEIFDARCKQGRQNGNEQYQSQKSEKDGVTEGENQHTEGQKQDLEMHDEYENLDRAQCASEMEQIDASKMQEENEDMNQQLKEHRRDACTYQRLQEDGVGKSQQLEEQNQEMEVREEYENLDQARQSLEEEKIYASKEQKKFKDVNQQLNEQQDAVNIGEDKGVAERMMGLEMLVEFGGKSRKSRLECEQNSASEKIELEGNCSGRTNALEQRLDTASVKKSRKVKAVRVVQQVEKRQLRSQSNKAQSIESEVKRNIIVPSHKSSETGQYTEEQKQDLEMHDEYEEKKSYATKEQDKNEDVNQQLNEQQDAVNIGEDKGVAERLEILVNFGGRSRKSVLECEQNSASEKMEVEVNCSGRTNALEQRLDTSSVKKSPKVKAVRVVQQVEKRQLRSWSNKAQPIESEVMGSIIVPSRKSSETGQHNKLKVTKQLEQGTRRSSRLQKSTSRN